jgi:hypothetical protein
MQLVNLADQSMLAPLSRWTLPPVVLIAALGLYRLAVVRPAGPAVVLARNEPLAIAPRHSDPRVVTDEQLLAVLARVLPPTKPVNTNNYVHALRLWGAKADFQRPDVPTGEDLRRYFLDDAEFRRVAGEATPPLFYRSPRGVEVRGYDDRATDQLTSSFHTDDLLATLAESGTPLDTPLRLPDGQTTVGELLATSLSTFHLERLEYEWTAIAYARYVFPQRDWRNRFGERITIDTLVGEITGHSPELGPCNGLHRLEALAVLHRANEQVPALRPRTREAALHYMQGASAALAAAQLPDGTWSREWPRGTAAVALATKSPPSLHDKLLVTGHHLEWLALAPEAAQPPRECVVRAAQWLARALVEMDEKELINAYGPYTHAARALCLWRGVEPWEFWKQAEMQYETKASSNELLISAQ